MVAFSGVDGSSNRHAQLNNIDDKNRYDIGHIRVLYLRVFLEQYRYRPPKTNGIDHKKAQLRKQCLYAMPAHKIGRLPVRNIEKQGSHQVDDGQWKSNHDGNQRHQVTVRSFFCFSFGWVICER